MTNHIIGIDPGQTGAVCMLNMQGEVEYLDNFDIENGFIIFYPLKLVTIPVFIEKPFLLPKQRGHEIVWRNYQTLFLTFNNPKLKEIRPQEWKKILGIPKGLSKKESLEYQFITFCSKAKKVDSDYINWYGTTKKGNPSTILDSGKIDAYCIALAGLKLNTK
jgi:hypothetical protein